MSCQSRRAIVAQGPFCSVEECSCGVLHVTFGAFTLRVQADVLESVSVTLGHALAKLTRGRTHVAQAGFARSTLAS